MYNNSDLHKENLKIARQKANSKVPCKHCLTLFTLGNIARHEKSCRFDISNHIECPVCTKLFYPKNKNKTCSYSCSNSYFRSGPSNPNWSDTNYRSTCFHYHTKQCVICQETNIVEVHHYDENHHNNDPSNLIPLCPTHHQYWHSKYKHLVEPKITEYISEWKSKYVCD